MVSRQAEEEDQYRIDRRPLRHQTTGDRVMQMESPVVRALELRRYEILEEAARSRLAAGAETHRSEKWAASTLSAWVSEAASAVALAFRRDRASRTPALGGDLAG